MVLFYAICDVYQSAWKKRSYLPNLFLKVILVFEPTLLVVIRIWYFYERFISSFVKGKTMINRGGVEDTRLEAQAKDTKKIRGQGQGQPFRGQTLSRPRTGMLEAKAKDQGHKRKCSPKKKKKRSSQKFFRRSSK